MARLTILTTALFLALASPASAARFEGTVTTEDGAAVPGAMVTFTHGEPRHAVTVFSQEDGGFASPELPAASYTVRVRRIGWQDLRLTDVAAGSLDLSLVRETDPAALAAQLPANVWYGLLLDRVGDEPKREELVRQCTFCHQQGSLHTRKLRDEEEWQKVLALMARMGAPLSSELRSEVPALFSAAYDPKTAVPTLVARFEDPNFAPPPPVEVRSAVVEEWELGERASMQHDIVVHDDGRIYSVDMMQDKLYRLDPAVAGGKMDVFSIPKGDLQLGGVFGREGQPLPPSANAAVGPHSLQVAPDGTIWITLALGNQLAGFDPATEEWRFFPLEDGFYPHTLRIDQKGRIWYTVAVSNHIGMLDPKSGEHRQIRLPAGSFGQAVVLRLLPVFLWLSQYVDLSGGGSGEGVNLPVPYGIDVAPDGGIWFSQLNEHKIGRIDPDSYAIELIDTPFTAPRRLRFDSQGRLWIPGFSSGLIASFDLKTREFHEYELPIEPRGSETPYALHVDHRSDTVWICGTNSDSLIRFEPATEKFTVYPLPTRVTYTRELDFDKQGRIWTSNSNVPTWQIEGGFPRVLRLDPRGATEDSRVSLR